MLEKACSICKKKRYAYQFDKDKRSSDGLRPECKACASKRGSAIIKNMNWRINHTESYKNRTVTVTKEDIEKLPNVCLFCNKPIEFSLIIHRIDNAIGYIKNNISKAHKICHAQYHNMQRKRNNKGQFMKGGEKTL
jgi:hypothetical protein